MSTTDKRPSREQSPPSVGGPTLCAIMVNRLCTAIGGIDSAFLYQSEAVDALAFVLTGLPSGPQRDAAFEQALAALEPIARPAPDVTLAALRGAA